MDPPGTEPCDVAITSPPTRGEPLRDDLLNALQPALVVVVDSDYPATARASPELKQRLELRPGSKLFTRDTGALRLDFRAGRCRIRSFGEPPVDLHLDPSARRITPSPAPD